MLATESPQLGFATHTTACSGIRMRISYPGQSGQLADLLFGKTTIGSSPRCNVRIQQPGVHPVHCLIFAGENSVKVRRWAADTMLNGVPFEETGLNIGDILSIGSVDIEILDAALSSIHENSADSPIGNLSPQGSNLILARSTDVPSLVALAVSDSRAGETVWPTSPLVDGAINSNEIRGELEVQAAPVQLEIFRSVVTATVHKKESLSLSDISFVANVEQLLARLRCSSAAARTRSRNLLTALRHDRGLQCRLRDQAAASEARFQSAASAEAAAVAKLNTAELELTNVRCRVRELESIAAQHDDLLANYQQAMSAKAELEVQLQRLAAEQTATVKNQELLTSQSAALHADNQRLAEENAHLLAETANLTGENAILAEERERVQEANARFQAEVARLAQEKEADASQYELLTNENQTLLEERERFQEENIRLQGDMTRLAQEKDIVASQNGLLSSDNQTLSKERDRLRQENTQAWDKIAWLTEDNKTLADLRSSFADELDQYRAELDQSRVESAAWIAAKQELEEGNQALVSDRDRLAQENTALQTTISQLTQAHADLCHEQSAAAEERDRLRQEFAQVENELTRLQEISSAQLAENVALTAEQERLRQESSLAWDKVVRLSEENRELIESSPDLRQELELLNKDNETLRDQIALLSEQITCLTGKLTEALEESDQLRQGSDKLQAEIAYAISESAAKEVKSAELGDVNQRLIAENGRLSDDISELRDELHRVIGEKNALIDEHQALADALNEERRLREAFGRQLEENSAASASQEETGNAVQRQLKDSQRDLAEAGKVISQFKADLSDMQREIVESTAKIENLEQLLAAQTQELSNTASELERIGQQFHEERRLRETLEEQQKEWCRQQKESEDHSANKAQRIEDFERAMADLQRKLGAPEKAEFTAIHAGEDSDRPCNAPSDSLDNCGGERGTEPATSFASAAGLADVRGQEQSESYTERFVDSIAENPSTIKSSTECLPPHASNSEFENHVPHEKSAFQPFGATPAPATEDDEESIELYMAKLMQRVRGDGPQVSASQTSASSAPSSIRTQSTKAASTSLPQAVHVNEVEPGHIAVQVPTPNLKDLMRKGPILENAIDLEAFRSLANESARRAIGVHANRKHRRDAFTKAIFSTIAGMMGIGLMLYASSWRDLQFISGCVSLLIAAYWAGQAYRALTKAVRASDFERFDVKQENALEPFRTQLPIDVEHKQR